MKFKRDDRVVYCGGSSRTAIRSREGWVGTVINPEADSHGQGYWVNFGVGRERRFAFEENLQPMALHPIREYIDRELNA